MINIIKQSKVKEDLSELFAEFTYDQIDRLEHINKINTGYTEELISSWRGKIRKSNQYYTKIRKVLSYYKESYEQLGFPSFDEVYKQYLDKKRSIEERKIMLQEQQHPDYELIIQRRNDYETIPKNADDEPEFIPNSEEYNNYVKYLESLPNEFNPNDNDNEDGVIYRMKGR